MELPALATSLGTAKTLINKDDLTLIRGQELENSIRSNSWDGREGQIKHEVDYVELFF